MTVDENMKDKVLESKTKISQLIDYVCCNQEKVKCLRCSFSGKSIVHHYKTVHPGKEVSVSRLEASAAKSAIEEWNNEFENTGQPTTKTKDYRFSCRFCSYEIDGKREESMESAYEHVSSHTGEYRFRCTVCNYQSIARNTMKIHYYKNCKKFGKTFHAAVEVRKVPQRKHLYGYMCLLCNFVQLRMINLEDHMRKWHHFGPIPSIVRINMSLDAHGENALQVSETLKESVGTSILHDEKSASVEKRNTRSSRRNRVEGEGPQVTLPGDLDAEVDKEKAEKEARKSSLKAPVTPPDIEKKNEEIELVRKKKIQKVVENMGIDVKKKVTKKGHSNVDKFKDRMDTAIESETDENDFRGFLNSPESGVRNEESLNEEAENLICSEALSNADVYDSRKVPDTNETKSLSVVQKEMRLILRRVDDPPTHALSNQTIREVNSSSHETVKLIPKNMTLTSSDLKNLQSNWSMSPVAFKKHTDDKKAAKPASSPPNAITPESATLTPVPISKPITKSSTVTLNEKTTAVPPATLPNQNLATHVGPSMLLNQKEHGSEYSIMIKNIAAYNEMMKPERLRELFKCMERDCSYTTDNVKNFKTHFEIHDFINATTRSLETLDFNKCAYCSMTATDWHQMEKHYAEEHAFCAFQCSYCFYRAVTQAYVEIHQVKTHPTEEVAVLKGSVSHTLRPHIEIDCSEHVRPFVCQNGCNKSFFSPELFLVHLKWNHNTLPMYKCHLCKVPSNTPDQLIEHYKKHGILKYQCCYCYHGTESMTQMHFHLSSDHCSQQPILLERILPPQTTKTKTAINQIHFRNPEEQYTLLSEVIGIPGEKSAGRPGCSQSASPLKENTPKSTGKCLLNTSGPEIIEEGSSSEQPNKFFCLLCDMSSNLESHIQQHIKSKHLGPSTKPISPVPAAEFCLKENEVPPGKEKRGQKRNANFEDFPGKAFNAKVMRATLKNKVKKQLKSDHLHLTPNVEEIPITGNAQVASPRLSNGQRSSMKTGAEPLMGASSEQKFNYWCTYCNDPCEKHLDMKQHCSRAHKDPKSNDEAKSKTGPSNHTTILQSPTTAKGIVSSSPNAQENKSEGSSGSSDERWNCEWCDKLFQSKKDMKHHHVGFHSYLPLKCPPQNPKGYRCPECSLQLKDYKLLYDHIISNHVRLYKCKYCERSSSEYSKVITHSKKFHPGVYPKVEIIWEIEKQLSDMFNRITDGSGLEHR